MGRSIGANRSRLGPLFVLSTVKLVGWIPTYVLGRADRGSTVPSIPRVSITAQNSLAGDACGDGGCVSAGDMRTRSDRHCGVGITAAPQPGPRAKSRMSDLPARLMTGTWGRSLAQSMGGGLGCRARSRGTARRRATYGARKTALGEFFSGEISHLRIPRLIFLLKAERPCFLRSLWVSSRPHLPQPRQSARRSRMRDYGRWLASRTSPASTRAATQSQTRVES